MSPLRPFARPFPRALRGCGACLSPALALGAALLVPGGLEGQGTDPALAGHLATAREAAAGDHGALFNLLCPRLEALPQLSAPLPASPPGLPARPGGEAWASEPVRVFDNLFYVGQTEYSAWAVTTSEGIVVIDALFAETVAPQIEGGLRELGLDPADIRYVIVSHGHSDHVGGAAWLQERFGARIVMSEADWELVEGSRASWPKPRRDIVAEDGHEIRLGEVTLTLHLTPGHTPGTLSTVVSPVRDGDRRHVAAAWGGTAFNFRGTEAFPREHWLAEYAASAARFREAARSAGADVLIANHPRFDGTPVKVPLLEERAPGDPHPYRVGAASVDRYLAVAESCANAAILSERDP